MPDRQAADKIRAAGAVLWRPAGRGVQVALIHRPKYDDWGLAKGKLEPGEHPLLAAVREVAEETGLRITLGLHLPPVRYLVEGEPKVVDYWAARVDASCGTFTPNHEVDRLDWVASSRAAARPRRGAARAVHRRSAADGPDHLRPACLRRIQVGLAQRRLAAAARQPRHPAGQGAVRRAALLWRGPRAQLSGRAVPRHRPALCGGYRRRGGGHPRVRPAAGAAEEGHKHAGRRRPGTGTGAGAGRRRHRGRGGRQRSGRHLRPPGEPARARRRGVRPPRRRAAGRSAAAQGRLPGAAPGGRPARGRGAAPPGGGPVIPPLRAPRRQAASRGWAGAHPPGSAATA